MENKSASIQFKTIFKKNSLLFFKLNSNEKKIYFTNCDYFF